MKWGVLFRPGSFWVGAHYSRYNRRWCINPVPMVTLWIAQQGGKEPGKASPSAPTLSDYPNGQLGADVSDLLSRKKSQHEPLIKCAAALTSFRKGLSREEDRAFMEILDLHYKALISAFDETDEAH